MEQEERLGFWALVTVGGYALVVLFLVIPLGAVLQSSLVDPETGRLSLGSYRELLTEPYYRSAIGHSLLVSICGTAGSLLLGIPLAVLTTRYRIPGKNLLRTLAVLSLLSPPFIGAYSWILMLGQSGFVRQLAAGIGLDLPTIYGPGGIILVFSLQYYPFVFLLTSAGLTTVDRSIEEAAENLGATGWRKLSRVTLPLVLPSLSAGAVIAFMMSLANFGTPKILGNYRVLPTLAYDLYTSEVGESPGLAAAVCVLLIICSTVVLLIHRRLSTRRKYASALVRRPLVQRLSGAKRVLGIVTCYGIVVLSTLPLLVVAASSFRNTSGPVFQPGLGLDSYRRVLYGIPQVIGNSVVFSLLAVALMVAAGVLLGFVVSRRRTLAAKVLDPLLMIPYVVPGIVLGLGFVVAFNRSPLILVGTGSIIVLAYFVRRLPYSVRSSSSILEQIDPAIEEAAINLGASPARAFGNVTLPLMLPGILAGAVLGWVTAINELSASIVLYVGGTMTMPVRIYLAVLDGDYGPAAALSTLLLVGTGVALYGVNRLGGGEGLEV